MSKSDYLEDKILQHLIGAAVWTAPAQIYAGLYSAAPSDAGGGTELTGNGYARQAADFSMVDTDTADNDLPVTFSASGGDWLEATHIGLFDAVSGGNLLWSGPLTAPFTLNDGVDFIFAAGEIIISDD